MTQTKTQDSTTEVNLRLDGPRETVSFKCNRKLWKAFVSEIKAEGLSVCHVLEPYVLAYLTSKVYLSSTIKPLRIENLVVERAVRRVRRYGVEAEISEGCRFCGGETVGQFRYVKTGEIYPLCRFHSQEFVDSKTWSVVK
jgi:hypothetical protein